MSTCKTKKCGCLDTGLTTQPPCIHDTPECPNPDPCSETFSDCCVVHDGDGIADLNIQTGDRLCDILQKISLAISNVSGGSGVTIQSVTTVGNDLVITMTDGTIFTTPLPAPVIPNDPWVTYTDADPEITSFVVNNGITTNTQSVSVSYKVLSYDTAAVKVRANLNVTVATTGGFNQLDVDKALDFSLILAPIPIGGSQWFPTQTGTITSLFPDFLGVNQASTVSIARGISVPGDTPLANSEFDSSGRGSASNGLIFCQQVHPHVKAGTYTFSVEWEMICRIGHPL